MIIGKELQDENKYLNKTIGKITDLLTSYGVSSEEQDKEIIKHRKFLWDNRNELDEIEINENCGQVALNEQLHAKKISRIRTLEKQLSNPYFARIDFKEDGEESESFYIGLSTVEDEDNFDIFVFDWRSPVANMFYDFEVGPAYYDAPVRRIEGHIEFTRQYNIRNGEIVFMHNSNESLCDEALTSMLSGNATDKMKNIVASIQKEQNDIIRSDDSKILFIQGAAGSGKTSIALHRSAYLLYKHRKNLSADNILIFSPNEVFAEYISDVLPELGESNIRQTTFEIFSKRFLPSNYLYESKNDHLDYIYSNHTDLKTFKLRTKSMEYKNTLDFMNTLNKFILDIPRLITNVTPITIEGVQIVSKKSVEKTIFERFKDIPFLNRIDVVKQSLFSQVENKYLSSKDNSHFDYVEDKKTFYDFCKAQVDLQVDAMIKTLDSVAIYKSLWSNIEKYTDIDLNNTKDLTLNYLNNNEVKFEDITPIIYIRSSLEGFRSYGNMKHVLVDEAQDYSPLFYEIVKRSFPNASLTIMGDLNQRIDKHSNVKSRNSITNVFNDVKTVVLTKSYRSTGNITNFTKDILETHEPIEAVDRIGDNPTIHIVNNNLEERISTKINEMKDKGYKSIAIICKNKENSKKLYSSLKELNDDINLIISDKCEFKIGINVISSYIAKGLEFDGVILADGESYLSIEDKHLFYTACTRALHELHIYTNTSLENILPQDNSLYTLIDN
ncbi:MULTISPECIES: HelD family protein [Clostridium]|uniref:HelD family protein n=2 Tax=Clostridiaceae TaxID=31979 RepID=UPI0004B03F9B|nr:UvrD-helicase domain-containing protein [Clostridium saudiense]MDU7454952.1 AAA family ATPase [Clostridium saudiense]MEE0728442.1 AAA family ATPase [Clostridium saudiense]SCJ98852.1 Helicase IV [uncultured Clostridium sp.]